MFLESTFKFQEESRFDIIFKDTKGMMPKEFLKMMKNVNWIFDADQSLISIGDKSNNYKIMGIYVTEKETQIYFMLKESPIVLKVLKEGWN